MNSDDDSNLPEIPEEEENYDLGEDWETHLDKKANNDPEPTLHNARLYLEYHPDWKGSIIWNEYAKRMEITTTGVLRRYAKKCCEREYPNAEDIVTVCQDELAHTYKISVNYRDLQRRVVRIARRRNNRNPLTEHLLSLGSRWDGIPRIDDLFVRYFGAGKTAGPVPTDDEKARIAHLRRIGRKWPLGAVERAFRPGCKVDNILILEGAQGVRKTSALEILGGEFYCSTQINLGDKDSKMIAASNWIIDMPDTNFMKKENRGFITMREDTFRPPFGAAVEKTKRICILVGSMNDYQYFEEDERRYWPVRCGEIDLDALRRDRDQIWAEAVAISLASEKCPDCHASSDTVAGQAPKCRVHRWWLDAEEEKESLKEASERVYDQPWRMIIHEWWLDTSIDKRPEHFTTADIAMGVLKIDEANYTRGVSAITTAIGIAVKSLGFVKERKTLNGVRHWVYRPTPELATAPHIQKSRHGLFAMHGGKAAEPINPKK